MRFQRKILFKEIIIVILLFALLAHLAVAQNYTVSGFVKDADSGEDLIGATVQVEALGIGTVTNEYGFYSFELPDGEHEISASYIGFDIWQKSILISTDLKLDIDLPTAASDLREIVVTSAAKDENVKSTQMGVEKLQVAQIKKVPVVLGEVDILKTLLLLPGVSNVGEGTTGFNVRGGGADQNLILLDEATIYNASHLLGFFSVFNADAIKDVKLYKGGIPARYGGRLSSVLEVRQREGNKKSFGGSAGIGLIASRLALEGPIAKGDKSEADGSWLIAGRRSYADVFLNMTEDFKDDKLFFYDFNAKANYSLGEKDRLFLSGYLGRDRIDLAGLLGNSWGNRSMTLRWNHLYSDELFGNLSATASRYDYSLKSFRPGTEFEWTSDISTISLRKNFNYFLNNNNELNFGVEGNNTTYRPGEIRPLRNSNVEATDFNEKYSLELGAYVSNDQKITDWLAINYGIRYSRFYRLGKEIIRQYENDAPVVENEVGALVDGEVIGEKKYSNGETISSFDGWEPRFSARISLGNTSSLKMGYNRMFQYVHLISNTTSATPLDIWTPSGPYKKPQRSDQVAVGYFRNFSNNEYELSVESFYKWLDNLVDFVDGADLILNNYLETEIVSGTGRAYGVEFMLRKNTGRFTGWLSYTLSRSERKVEGVNGGKYYPSNYDKTHDLSITALYDLTNRLTFGANFVYATGQPVTYPSGKYDYSGLLLANYSNRNGDRLPAYHRLDLSATLKNKPGKKRESQWIFSLYNVYNRLNAASITFRERAEDASGNAVATGISEAVKLSYFGLVPGVTYEIKF